MAHKFFEEKRPHNGMTYEEFKKNSVKEIENIQPEKLEGIDKKYYEYRKINLQRSKRLDKQFQPSEELIEAVIGIDEPQLWMVITETWCGDSAQNLPIIAKAAELNDKIDLRILLRDSNTDIIDHYLTNGTSRSIPILVAFDLYGNEIFKWGPRPDTAKTLVTNLKHNGFSKEEFNQQLHLWYGRNRGKELESELLQILKKFDLAANTVVGFT
jgi:hypothetical protein